MPYKIIVKKLTQAKRESLSNSKPTVVDYTRYPGIVDHSTCFVVKVGRFVRSQSSTNIKEKDKKGITSRHKSKESQSDVVLRSTWDWSNDTRMQLLFEKYHMGIAEGYTKQEALKIAQQFVREKFGIYDWEDEAKS